MHTPIAVHSEIGRLRRVITHTPGPEVQAVTPATREEFLYDDIVDLEGARNEHGRFVSVLRRFVGQDGVLDARELLEQTLVSQAAREFLLTRSEEVTADRTLKRSLKCATPEVLAQRFIEGWRLPAGPFSECLDKQAYVIPPLPNLFFTRDAAIGLGRAVLISSMRFHARWPEEALMRTIFGFHPALRGVNILYDGSDERRHDYRLEGGDVHPLREDVLLVGLSERTTAASIDALSSTLFHDAEVTDIVAVLLPERSTAIHLDMVWTQLDRQMCAAYAPMFRGPTRAPILHRRKGETTVRQPDSLFAVLAQLGLPMEAVWCGDGRPEVQDREQWASGCNFLAVAPGQVLSYARNEATVEALQRAGFRVVNAESLLLGEDKVNGEQRVVITFSGPELVRGGGGPRCMTCPIARDEL